MPQPQPYLQEYFAKFPGFTYDPFIPPPHEFNRLAKRAGWDPKTREKEVVGFRKALERQFNSVYGKKEHHAEHWQGLCRLLKIFPVPEQLGHCKAMFLTVFVNVIDLIHLSQSQEELQTFETIEDLAQYTREKGRYFPTRRVQIGGIIGTLLRHIKEAGVGEPDNGSDGNDRRRRRRRGGHVPGAGPLRESRNQRKRRRNRERRQTAAANPTGTQSVEQISIQLAAVSLRGPASPGLD